MRLTRLGVAVVVLAAAGVVGVGRPAAGEPAAEPSTLQCASSVPVYRVTTAGDMLLYQHNEPETGGGSWAPAPPRIGAGWQKGRSIAAPGGVIYAAWEDGALRRYRHISGTTWETFNGSGHQVIDATGWQRYVTPEYKNRITVDSDGFIYTVEPDGNLHQRAYNPTTQEWTHRVIDAGWSQFNLIVAGGPGMLYARKPTGELLRYRFHSASQRWLLPGQQIGVGWQIFDRVFSPGGDLLYGVRPDHTMMWYRYNENTETWESNTGRVIGAGWIDWNTHAAPDACKRVGTTVPTRPLVTRRPNAPATLMRSGDGHVHYAYVDSEDRAVHAEITDIFGGTPAGAAAIPGMTGVTGQTGLSQNQDGTVQVFARRTDSEILTSTRPGTGGAWQGTGTLGGFVNGPATAVRLGDGRVAVYAADDASQIWYRRQPAANGPLTGWLKMPTGGMCTPPCTQPVIDDSPLFADNHSGSIVRLIARDRDGRYWTIAHGTTLLQRWSSLGTQRFVGAASVVVMPDNTRQVFATGTDGVVYTQRETSRGFPGTWTAIPGVTASGPPSAIMAPDGTLQIVVRRASDGLLYFTGQPAPGAGGFNPWADTNLGEQSSTDPTALAVPERNTWVLAYRNDIDVPRLAYFVPSARAGFTSLAIELN